MIEPINVVGALRRSWRLLVALAVIVAIIAVLAPVGTAKHTAPKFRWSNLAVVGAEPPVGASAAGVNSASILFSANNYYTKVQAAESIGLRSQEAAKLAPLMSGVASDYNVEDTRKQTATTAAPKNNKKSSQTNVVELYVVGETPKLSVELANAYALVVGKSVNHYFNEHQAAPPPRQKPVDRYPAAERV